MIEVDPLLQGFHSRGVTPRHPGIYARISNDPLGLERGVNRQIEDARTRAAQLGWGDDIELYVENDTSAFRKRQVTLLDGTTGYRVIRPVYRKALADLQSGAIDGLLVWDIDRLARETRDLEDLIDIVVHTRRPARGVTSDLDLITADGQMAARIMVVAAHKSSQDTGRRVARALAEKARSGRQHRNGSRPFGWAENWVDIDPIEGPILRQLIQGAALGRGLGRLFEELLTTGVPPTKAQTWRKTTLRQMLRSPRVAGVRGYKGRGRQVTPGRDDWRNVAVRDLAGDYVMGDWLPLVDVITWEAANVALDGKTTDREWRRSHLLSGIARCGLCGAPMYVRHRGGAYPGKNYVCPGKATGSCGKISRKVELLEPYVVETIARTLETLTRVESGDIDTGALDALQERLAKLRAGYASGSVSDDTFFLVLPALEREFSLAQETLRREIRPLSEPSRMAEVWADPQTPIDVRRSLLRQLVSAIKIMPAERAPRGQWDPAQEVVFIWA